MAINSNFVFTDAVPAQQAVSMAQIAAAQEAARQQMMSDTLRSVTAGQVARENAAQQRYLTQSQIAQDDKRLAQKDRESILMADIYKQQGTAVTAQNANKERDARAKIQYDTILNALDGGLPSPGKWKRALENPALVFNPDEKANLDSKYKALRSQAEKNYNMSSGIANAIQAQLDKIDPNDKSTRQTLIDDAEKRYKGLIMFNPEIGRMVSVFPKLEVDEEETTGRVVPVSQIAPPPAVAPVNSMMNMLRSATQFGGIGMGLNSINKLGERLMSAVPGVSAEAASAINGAMQGGASRLAAPVIAGPLMDLLRRGVGSVPPPLPPPTIPFYPSDQ
jgi:hypothetical protein